MPGFAERRFGFLPASTLKLIACIFMAIDHIGAYFFPGTIWLRIVGRISYPIFAYLIAEGCTYTRNKLKRLLLLLIPGLLFDAVYIIIFKRHYGNIFLTFSLSIVLIYGLQWLKSAFSEGNRKKTLLALIVFLGLVGGVWLVNREYHVEYGVYGILVPVFAAFFEGEENRDIRLFSFSAGLVLLSVKMGISNIQVWSLMSVPVLALYNGKAGTRKYKYGFYIFYPVHLMLIWCIGWIMQNV